MKALARSYCYWSGMDKEIERVARSCSSCSVNANENAKVEVHPWELPDGAWQRIHIDFAGPIKGQMILVIVDAYSKWTELFVTKTTTSTWVINKLRQLFTCFGLPVTLVSDNGSQFTSKEFEDFLREQGISHLTSAPYHPSSNGLAERGVQSMKQSLRKMSEDGGTLESKIQNFLIQYRRSPHSSTGRNESLILYPPRQDGVRKQLYISSEISFPCENSTRFGRSKVRPDNVHKLRPGDIDVVGAMGDSLVAGNGALEEYALGTFIEYRGVSWCAGGDGIWRQYMTLPNILKEFNPNVAGYSIGQGEFLAPNSHMNVAFPVSADEDALRQAQHLIKKMKREPGIDFKHDWKLITIFFGANDLCSGQCYNKEGTTALQHQKKLKLALDYLQDHMPRTFVNLVPVLGKLNESS
ncbi:phospholipase B1, membrane-associated-like [Diaphorina citri]|uniref:Phospholipase B1, membrane-associated-like n=1 Tax=Diaphorina citri TaxID=121845 RepID=A0A1S3DJ89_DIACI|nr:phospholipase B1, membrane-associated-like [Diaphorina citri]